MIIVRARRATTCACLAAIVAAAVGCGRAARADDVVQYLESARLAPESIEILDPVKGSSAGTPGHALRIAAGDVIVLRYAVASVPLGAVRGIQSYLTVYVPPGAELVGARFVDAGGRTVEPRQAGLALDGCNSPNCTPATPSGSIAQVYADTGVFYSDTTRSGDPFPAGTLLSLDAGHELAPTPAGITDVVGVLGDASAPWYAHSSWDRDHARAFDAGGNTQTGYGSPVAGPQTGYSSEVDADLGRTGVVGPWQRIRHRGSRIGTGSSGNGDTSIFGRVGFDTTSGFVLAPATPRAARAVRFAAGQSHAGEVRHAEVALRVVGVPLDPAADVDRVCAEAFGSDISSKSTSTGGQHHPWRSFVPHPACVDLRMPLTLDVDRPLASAGAALSYRVAGRNLAMSVETNASVVISYDPAKLSFDGTSSPSTPVTCPAVEAGNTCRSFPLGELASGEAFGIDFAMTPAASAASHAVVRAYYQSDSVTAYEATGRSARAVTVLAAIPAPVIALDNALDATAQFAAPGSAWTVSGTIASAGTGAWSADAFTLTLPATTWGLVNNRLLVGGVVASCTLSGIQRTCSLGSSFAAGQSRSLGFQVAVPAGVAAGLYPIGIGVSGTGNFIGRFETDFARAVAVPVGAVRSAAPAIDCPVRTAEAEVTGTAEPGAAVQLRIGDGPHGSAAADAGGVFVVSDFGSSFGPLYDGAELRATAQAAGEHESVLSEPCFALTINRAPTLDPLADPAALANDGRVRTVALAGIGSGVADFPQALDVAATSSDPSVIPHPDVTYASPDATGSLSYAALPGRVGTVTITVTVVDSGGTANGGVDAVSRSFMQAVAALPDALFANGFE